MMCADCQKVTFLKIGTFRVALILTIDKYKSAEILLLSFFAFLAASKECSAGSNDHFVVPSLVQFDGRPLDGANLQYYH
jgi:hypothetical protein